MTLISMKLNDLLRYNNNKRYKLNVKKINLMRQTNKKTNEFIKQLLEKENRMEFYNLNGTTTELFEKIKI